MHSKQIPLQYYANAIPSFHIKKAINKSDGESVHYHDFYQIYFISRGTLTFYYLGKTKILGKCDVFIVPPQTAHRIEMGYGVELYSIAFLPSFFSEKYISNHLIDFLKSLSIKKGGEEYIWPQIILSADLRQICEEFCQLMLDEFSSRKTNYEYVILGIMIALLSLLERSHIISQGLNEYPYKNETARKEILMYIDTMKDNFTKKLSLNSASQATLISKPLFCKIFLEITGMTYNQYLNKLRIEYSTELIINTKLSMVEIAEKSGYGDFSTFYRNFIRIIGVSPSQYRDIFYSNQETDRVIQKRE